MDRRAKAARVSRLNWESRVWLQLREVRCLVPRVHVAQLWGVACGNISCTQSWACRHYVGWCRHQVSSVWHLTSSPSSSSSSNVGREDIAMSRGLLAKRQGSALVPRLNAALSTWSRWSKWLLGRQPMTHTWQEVDAHVPTVACGVRSSFAWWRDHFGLPLCGLGLSFPCSSPGPCRSTSSSL